MGARIQVDGSLLSLGSKSKKAGGEERLKGVRIHYRDDEGNEFSKEISVGDTEDVGTILRSRIEVIKIEEIEE